MANINIYTTNILDYVKRHESNPTLQTLGKTYVSILEGDNYKDADVVMKEFIYNASAIALNENERNDLTSAFKFITLKDMGVEEVHNRILTESAAYKEPMYKERIDVVSQLLEKSESDYEVIQDIIKIYETISHDSIVNESLNILNENLEKNQDDVKVLNVIEYLQNSPLCTKYKKTCNDCVELLKKYNINPVAKTRAEALDCLKTLEYDNVIKDFVNYLTSVNFSDDTYSTNEDTVGSLATGRTYTGDYLDKWHNGTAKAGLGKIVVESITDGKELLAKIPERKVLQLLLERLSDESIELNSIDRKFKTGIETIYTTFDLGLYEAAQNLKNHVVISNTKTFQRFYSFVNEGFNKGVADKKMIHTAYNLLESLNFDSKVLNELAKITEKFESSKERMLVENTLEYIQGNNHLGLFEGLKNDLTLYLDNPSNALKNKIMENYTNVVKHDNNVYQMLNTFGGIQSKGIVNSNPDDFIIESVYSIYEHINGVDHFIVDGNYILKKGDNIAIVDESKISPKVLQLTQILEAMNIKVQSSNHIIGNFSGQKIDIKLNEKSSELYINGVIMNEGNMGEFIALYENVYNGMNSLKQLKMLNENINSLVEMDFITCIKSKQDPRVRVNLFNLDDVKYINFIHEGTKFNKFSKTSKYLTLKSKLIEFMGFDISESFSDKLGLELNNIDTMKNKANNKLQEIRNAEIELKKLQETLSTLSDDLQQEGNLVYESFSRELDRLKKEYRETIETLEKML